MREEEKKPVEAVLFGGLPSYFAGIAVLLPQIAVLLPPDCRPTQSKRSDWSRALLPDIAVLLLPTRQQRARLEMAPHRLFGLYAGLSS